MEDPGKPGFSYLNMRLNKPSTLKRTVLLSIFAGFGMIAIGFAFINARYTSYITEPEIGIQQSEAATPSPTQKPTQMNVSKNDFPVRIEIPKLKVKAAIQQRGLNAKGEMATPTNFKDVAWYKLGTVPGNVGSAVMAGHLDNAIALSGVFKNLSQLRAGDEIYIHMNSGKKLKFVVDAKETYTYNNAPANTIFNRKDKRRLNLITCEGKWIKDKKTYSHRLVVYAVMDS